MVKYILNWVIKMKKTYKSKNVCVCDLFCLFKSLPPKHEVLDAWWTLNVCQTSNSPDETCLVERSCVFLTYFGYNKCLKVIRYLTNPNCITCWTGLGDSFLTFSPIWIFDRLQTHGALIRQLLLYASFSVYF